jgi:hypothetical protein
MRVSNFYGISYYFSPTPLPNINEAVNYDILDRLDNKILFFRGPIPSDELLYRIKTESELLETYEPIHVINSFRLVFTYNPMTKTKIVKKVPVEEMSMQFLSDGDLGWATIILNDLSEGDERPMIFTNSIGTWGEDDKIVIVEKLSGNKDEVNIFKDVSIILRDTCASEVS